MNTRLRKYSRESREILREDHASRKPPYKFYWAYGSNLCRQNMAERCPLARPYAPLIVDDGLLIFRGVADAIHREGGKIAGALYKITDSCERALDRFEGTASGLYSKKYMRIRTKGEEHPVLYYKMNSRGIMPPAEYYLDTILRGYQDWDLDLSLLNDAVMRSYSDKAVDDFLAERRARRGGKMAVPDYVERRTGLRFDRVKEMVSMPEGDDCERTVN